MSNKDLAAIIGGNVQKRRKEKGLSQNELAKLAGTYQVNVARVETGAINVSTASLHKICTALGVDAGEMFSE